MSLPASDRTKVADQRTTMDLRAVLPMTAEVIDGHLFVGGVDMVKLAREEGTFLMRLTCVIAWRRIGRHFKVDTKTPMFCTPRRRF